ncbi:hypothetical protein BDV93DRAFT_506419 [Ceratobasidium sp. AG-I]|nr:hypothetical protein BDV93DRAFT_506419 [Ceratobasidium sp. AG-I]
MSMLSVSLSCLKTLVNDSAWRQHIANSPQCRAAEHAALKEEVERQRKAKSEQDMAKLGHPGPRLAASGVPKATTSAGKCRKVTVETVVDESEMELHAPMGQPLQSLDPFSSHSN